MTSFVSDSSNLQHIQNKEGGSNIIFMQYYSNWDKYVSAFYPYLSLKSWIQGCQTFPHRTQKWKLHTTAITTLFKRNVKYYCMVHPTIPPFTPLSCTLFYAFYFDSNCNGNGNEKWAAGKCYHKMWGVGQWQNEGFDREFVGSKKKSNIAFFHTHYLQSLIVHVINNNPSFFSKSRAGSRRGIISRVLNGL